MLTGNQIHEHFYFSFSWILIKYNHNNDWNKSQMLRQKSLEWQHQLQFKMSFFMCVLSNRCCLVFISHDVKINDGFQLIPIKILRPSRFQMSHAREVFSFIHIYFDSLTECELYVLKSKRGINKNLIYVSSFVNFSPPPRSP